MYRADLNSSIKYLSGVGKAILEDYKNLLVFTQKDLLNLAPRSYDNRLEEVLINPLNTMEKQQIISEIKILSHSYFGENSKIGRTLKVISCDKNGQKISLLCFGRNFLSSKLIVGKTLYIAATVSMNNYEWQTSSFEIYSTKEEAGLGSILPIYPLSGKLSQRIIRRNIKQILSSNTFNEELPQSVVNEMNLLSTDTAIREFNFPHSTEMLEKAKKTLAFTELFYLQLQLHRNIKPNKHNFIPVTESELEKKLIASLPFSLTRSQEKVLREIRSDLYHGNMERLLEGDVGSGKTLVAWLSSLFVIDKGGQVAFMAPTELLARQHAENAAAFLSPLGIRLAYVTGDVKGKGRNLLLKALKEGEIDIAIGTHALFSKDIVFKNLSYAIIDEQHRFGVEQRKALKEKGENTNILLMSATPIPRTLALTVFGDSAISTIETLPQGRKPIITYTVREENREKMYEAIKAEFFRQHQAYFVYPRIGDEEEDEESQMRDVNKMFVFLKKKYPNIPSALIHSKLPEEEKQQILTDFKNKKILYLVATSVIEVGIDIPDATCMIIEHADRFGLAALHQLRGRVGRSNLQSYCFLVFSPSMTDVAKARLQCMKDSTDGFYIAEQDLLIRGPGEISGLQQSGFLKLKFASITQDIELLKQASITVKKLLKEDFGLIKAENHTVLNNLRLLEGT